MDAKQPEGEKKQNQLRRQLDLELDRLEIRIEELRVQYEQYFVDIVPHPPDKLHNEIKKFIRHLLKAPFKNSASRFRLRTLIQRFQTYCTYWERVNKQREEGTYIKDVFKADLREQLQAQLAQETGEAGAALKGLRQLFSTYQDALRKNGNGKADVNFDSFKKSLMKQAKALKEKHGNQKLQYKVMVKDGKVVIRASVKKS